MFGQAYDEPPAGPPARSAAHRFVRAVHNGGGDVVAPTARRRALGKTPAEVTPVPPLAEIAQMTDDNDTGADGLGPARQRNGAPARTRPGDDEAVKTNEETTKMTAIEYRHSAVDVLGEIPHDVLRRVAVAHRRARRLLDEVELLVREQVELESVVGARVVADDDIFYELREASGLVALDSVLGNAAGAIAAAGGGLWCGGAPRPWPTTAWQLPPGDLPGGA